MTASDATIPGRSLAYLADVPIDRVKGIGPVRTKKLTEAGIPTVGHFLLYAPRRYLDRSQMFDLARVPVGEEVTVGGVVERVSRRRISRGRTMIEAVVRDATATVRAVWFNPYFRIAEGEEVTLSGTIEEFRGRLQMKNPSVDRFGGDDSYEVGRIMPVYAKVGGVASRDLRPAMDNALRRSRPISEIVPAGILDRMELVSRDAAIAGVHFPESLSEVEPARRRLIFDEFLRIQMALKVREHDEFTSRVGVVNEGRGELARRFRAGLPYSLTGEQEAVLARILADMGEPRPMHRLLQGEVGSGKTVVVILALLNAVESGHQGAVMAPTEVLVTQHFLGTALALEEAGLAPERAAREAAGRIGFDGESTSSRGVRIGLFAGNRVTTNFVHGDVSRTRGLEWLEDGTLDIAFGTQALIQEGVSFRSLGVTVVDEQHRFGVEQRVVLRDRHSDEGVPDLLLMTATPIPRTLAMTLYGDLEVSTIREMPPGRTGVVTEVVAASDDAAVDRRIRATVAEGRQAFVVCPLVDDSEKVGSRSATAEHARILAAHPEWRCELIHGQMRSVEKAEVMHRVRRGVVDVLVSTTVIEVGVDVPNATLMVIRDAERFGLSQLHQLRGRVGRGEHPGSCLLAADPSTPEGRERIAAMTATNDGFELARMDLEIRGQGTVFGGAQSGATDLRLGDLLRDRELLFLAREVAEGAVAADRHGPFVEAVMEEVGLLLGDSAQWLTRS